MSPAVRRFGRGIERALAIVGVLFLVYHGLFELSEISTNSMAPLLMGDGQAAPDVILVERRVTGGRAPARRFQVVSFRDEEGMLVAKRVVAFGGETIRVLPGRHLLIDERPVEEPFGVGEGRGYLEAGNLVDGKPYVVPAGHVYVLGDHAQDSADSRFIGSIAVGRIRGRVLARVWPLARLRWLD